jgi:hypothetical protein
MWKQRPPKGYMAAYHQLHGEPMSKSIGTRNRYTVGRDANHEQIVAAYEAQYTQVIDYTMVGHGHPDIGIVGRGFGMRLREIKMPGEDLMENQSTFFANWRGPPIKIIRTVEDAYADIAELNRR